MSSALHITNYEDVNSWETLMFLYNAALKEVGTKIDILNEEFQHIHRYNPIEHVKSRIKTPESRSCSQIRTKWHKMAENLRIEQCLDKRNESSVLSLQISTA